MSTVVSICNQALTSLGANTITSLGDQIVEAQLCNAHYAPLRDAVLEEHTWTFATMWIQPNKLATTPLGEYKNAYQLPPDTLRVIFVGQDYNHPRDYQREGMNIMTDIQNPKVQVISIVEDPTKFSAMFVQALVARLAAEMAIALTDSRTLAEQNFRLYASKVRDAAKLDNTQGKARRIRSGWIHRGRIGYGGNTFGPTV